MKSKQDNQAEFVTLRNEGGTEVVLTDYGARITGLCVPDNRNALTDVVLGFSTAEQYLSAAEPYHGATVGRFANRIARGVFSLDGNVYHVPPNNGENALHGGSGGFHNRFWKREYATETEAEFSYQSVDGEEGFPGNLSVWVTYTLTEDHAVRIRFRADTDAATVVNLTNHAFFNLNGEGSGPIADHLLQIHAEGYLPVDRQQIPTGEIRAVAGTAFDFREAKPIGQDIAAQDEQLDIGHGYDHCYVLEKDVSRPDVVAASAWSHRTGIRMDVFTTEPGMQLYTGNFLNGKDTGKSGNSYRKQEAFCLETQHFPDSPNQPVFPGVILLPGEIFLSETIFKFSVIG